MKSSGIEWIGDIPDDWSIVKIKHIGKLIGGSGFPEEYQGINGEEIPFIKVKSLVENPITREGKDSISELTRLKLKAEKIVKGSIVFAKVGAALLLQRFRVLEFDSCIDNNMMAFVPISINSIYFKYVTSLFDFSYFVNPGTVPSINQEQVGNINIPYPPLVSQQKIADYLDEKCGEIDKIIEKQKKIIEKLKAYKQSLISETVTKGLNKSTPIKPSGIDYLGDIPTHWDVKKLKTLLKEPLTYGANESGILFNENEPRYIRITDIKDEQSLRDDTPQSLPENKAKDYILQNDDILFARSGATVGKTFIYKSDFGRCAFAGYLIRARMDVLQMLPIFFIYYSLSFCYFEWKSRIFIQATIQNIGANKYNNMEIPTPPISEQNQIAEYLNVKCSEIDSTINKKQNLIEKLDAYKKSLIFEKVRGKNGI